jgi:hypothetical protein
MLHFAPLTQSRDVVHETAGFFRHVPVCRSQGPLFGRMHATAPSFPHDERAAQRTTAPRHSSDTRVLAASATQLT